jgi:hypothetical protein
VTAAVFVPVGRAVGRAVGVPGGVAVGVLDGVVVPVAASVAWTVSTVGTRTAPAATSMPPARRVRAVVAVEG